MLGSLSLYGYYFSLIVMIVISAVIAVIVLNELCKNSHVSNTGHVDMTAGDEGDD